MSVILDWVANHTSWDNPWIAAHKDWYLQDGNNNIVSPPGTGWNDVAQLNFNNSQMRLEMIRNMKFWIFSANIDGFRYDYTDGPPVDFWQQAIDTLRNIGSHHLLLLAEGSRAANYSAGFDFNFGFGFYGVLKSIYNSTTAVTSIDAQNTVDYTNASNGQQMVRYLTNHDVNGSDGTPLDLFGGKAGSLAAFVVVATMNSVPMIYNGQEVGTPDRIQFPFTGNTIDWSINPDITAAYKRILSIRNNSAAIRRGVLTSFSNTDVCAFTKEIAGEKVFIAINLRNNTNNFSLPATIANNSWTDLLNGGTVNTSGIITLPPYGYTIYRQ